MPPKHQDTDINLARLEVHFENMKGHLARIEGSISDLSQQLSDHANEEMGIYVRKDEHSYLQKDVDGIREDIRTMRTELDDVSEEVRSIMRKMAWTGSVLIAVCSFVASVLSTAMVEGVKRIVSIHL